jgi:TonB family protein
MQAKIQGQVGLSCVVLPDGSVGDVEVVSPLDPGLDEQAIKAARQWRFKAGTKDGRPVPVRIELDFTFTLR